MVKSYSNDWGTLKLKLIEITTQNALVIHRQNRKINLDRQPNHAQPICYFCDYVKHDLSTFTFSKETPCTYTLGHES